VEKKNTQIQSRFVFTESLQVPKKWGGGWRERDGVRRGREKSFFFVEGGCVLRVHYHDSIVMNICVTYYLVYFIIIYIYILFCPIMYEESFIWQWVSIERV
jgi:hypothetical protein